MSNWHHNQQFKLVDGGEKQWVKEIRSDGRADRHEVIEGPRGGKKFVGNDGNERNANAIPNRVNVYQEDRLQQVPKGSCHPGNRRGQGDQ